MKRLLSLLIVVALCSASPGRAEPDIVGANLPSVAPSSADSFDGQFVGPPAPPPPERTLSQKIACSWTSVRTALDRGNFLEAAPHMEELLELQRGAGLWSMEHSSLDLVRRAEAELERGAPDRAAGLIRWAETLSPHSVSVTLASARTAHLAGVRGLLSQVARAVRQIPGDRAFIVSLLTRSLYPGLWSLTLGIFLLMVIAWGYWMKAPLRFFGLKLPAMVRGVIAPLVVLPLLVGPIALGPLWSIALWSVMFLLLMPERRWLAFYGALVLGAWAALMPIRETLTISLSDPRVMAYLRASSGSYERDDAMLLASFLREYPTAAGVQYVYGTALLRDGKLPEADEAFKHAELLWKSGQRRLAAYAIAQRGTVKLIQEDLPGAENRFHEAAEQGLSQPGFTLIQSKLAFAKTDTVASRALLVEAEKASPALAAQVRELEERFGDIHPLALPQMPLPLIDTVESVQIPFMEVRPRAEAVSQHLMPGLDPLRMGGVAIVLLLLFFIRGEPPRRVRKEVIYPQPIRNAPLRLFVRMVPGGSLLKARRPGAALGILSLCLLLAMPLFGWPSETIGVLTQLPEFQPYIVSLAIFLGFGAVYVTWHLAGEED